jgi:DNA-binding response OmpR family regulator
MKKALIIDDEKRMLDLISLYLSPNQFECIKSLSGQEALTVIETTHDIDIVLLDVMMPGMDGWVTCKAIRELSSVPIIMLTARDQKNDIVKGLQLGADDYITKPFDGNELIARVNAVLRRVKGENKIEFKGLIWSEEVMQVSYEGKYVALTPKEFVIIGELLKNINRVFTREGLIENVWGFDAETEGRTIDSHVKNIREKLRKAGFPIEQHLQTVWGVGYKWISEE